MVTLSFNHIQGKNGSHWNRLMREEKAKEYCIVAIDAAKYVNTAMAQSTVIFYRSHLSLTDQCQAIN